MMKHRQATYSSRTSALILRYAPPNLHLLSTSVSSISSPRVPPSIPSTMHQQSCMTLVIPASGPATPSPTQHKPRRHHHDQNHPDHQLTTEPLRVTSPRRRQQRESRVVQNILNKRLRFGIPIQSHLRPSLCW